jgi:hypothetical protein
MTDHPEGFSKEHMNAVLAMITASLEERETGDSGNPVTLQAIARVINEVPRDVQALASLQLIHLLVRHLARVQGRTVSDVWQEMTLIYADTWPEDGTPGGFQGAS